MPSLWVILFFFLCPFKIYCRHTDFGIYGTAIAGAVRVAAVAVAFLGVAVWPKVWEMCVTATRVMIDLGVLWGLRPSLGEFNYGFRLPSDEICKSKYVDGFLRTKLDLTYL